MMAAAAVNPLPRHVAITMDGNGRWAKTRGLARIAGHKAGLEPVRMCISECGQRGIDALTLFAFSSENWRRPRGRSGKPHGPVRRVARARDRRAAREGRAHAFHRRAPESARAPAGAVAAAEQRTAGNSGLLQVAVSYGGRWDIVQAAQELAKRMFAAGIAPGRDHRRALRRGPSRSPALRMRIWSSAPVASSASATFFLWNLAYAELYFTDALWPDFALPTSRTRLAFFRNRERRFGQTSSQLTRVPGRS